MICFHFQHFVPICFQGKWTGFFPLEVVHFSPGIWYTFQSVYTTYIVTINQNGASKLGLKWNELSFNEIVGCFGHELGHILHYSQKTNGGIIWMGYKYSFARYKRKMERFTDQLAIDHNLGFALYDGTEYTLNCSKAKKSYKNKSRRFYLKRDEILDHTYTKETKVPNFRKTNSIKNQP